MEYLIKIAQISVSVSVFYVWIFRFHNVLKEFKSFGLNDLTRNFVGASKMALSTTLIVGVWVPSLVFVSSLLMAFFMFFAQYYHFKIKNNFLKHLPSLILLILSLTIAYYSMP